MNTTVVAGLGVAFVILLLLIRWKWRSKVSCPPCTPVQLVHRLCPHNNVVQRFEVEQKDSLDDHLDVLTRKLAEKEGRLRLSKSKIRETQNEIENLHAIDHDVRRGQRLYGEAAAELANNLAELQRGRMVDHRITEKPQTQHSSSSLRHRKEPQLPRATPVGSLVIKSSPPESLDAHLSHHPSQMQ
ncbi:hypothetical protein K1T71_013539 [Dendrolimus kikuchii]|uniref:Uncharacterized protein n=1 Tax=Dendrolimus kikuchii TaxID=765133 RepID=A0ACC1CH35_9NEOP|nr:hypothetical protein K1T71_013539 [Dendrolimus kikuchii]